MRLGEEKRREEDLVPLTISGTSVVTRTGKFRASYELNRHRIAGSSTEFKVADYRASHERLTHG